MEYLVNMLHAAAIDQALKNDSQVDMYRQFGRRTINLGPHTTSPYELFGEGRSGQGQPSKKKSRFSGPDQKFLSLSSNFKKTIALAFLKPTYPQFPY